MAELSDEMTLSYTYTKANASLNSGGGVREYLKGLSIVELFCQQHTDHYYVSGRCNIDLNTLHQVALSGLCATLESVVTDRLQECVSILYEYYTTVEGV